MLPAVIHLVATSFMIGVIWFVQLVHYPGFAGVGPEHFSGYVNRHVARTFWLVGPVMLVEAGTALWVVHAKPSTLGFVGIALLLATWVATAAFSVPNHERLQKGWDDRAARRLVLTNWVRTLCWTARGPIAAALVFEAV